MAENSQLRLLTREQYDGSICDVGVLPLRLVFKSDNIAFVWQEPATA